MMEQISHNWTYTIVEPSKVYLAMTESASRLRVSSGVKIALKSSFSRRRTSRYRFLRSKDARKWAGSRMPRLTAISCATIVVAVAVKPRIGTPGKISRSFARVLYDGRKSWPQFETQWHSSIAISFTPVRACKPAGDSAIDSGVT